jgi:hypothetical protein
VGLFPAECASLHWTHLHAGSARRRTKIAIALINRILSALTHLHHYPDPAALWIKRNQRFEAGKFGDYCVAERS